MINKNIYDPFKLREKLNEDVFTISYDSECECFYIECVPYNDLNIGDDYIVFDRPNVIVRKCNSWESDKWVMLSHVNDNLIKCL